MDITAADSTVGVATPGGHDHASGKSLVFAYVKPALATPGTELDALIMGERRKAKVIAEPAYDPKSGRLRG